MDAKWIWYPSDFELYHNMILHNRREEYDYIFPVMWHIQRPESVCCFSREVTLQKEQIVFVHAKGMGYVKIGEKKIAPVNTEVLLPAGTYILGAEVTNLETFPALFIDADDVCTDENWVVHFNGAARKYASCEPAFTKAEDDPAVFPFCYQSIVPKSTEKINGGILYDFGVESFGIIAISRTLDMGRIDIYYGESREEALDEKWAILRQHIPAGAGTYTCRARAFRYIYIRSEKGTPSITAEEEYLPIKDIAGFHCDDTQLPAIWDICARAFHLNAREFYLDGIKRDRWVWSGDAYQSYMIGRYLCNDRDITKRTIRALLGKGPYFQHINVINDYSMYMFAAVREYYEATGDVQFVLSIKEQLTYLYEFITSRLDEETGYVVARDGDWIFIDWADIDKDGPLCAEQILLYQVYQSMAVIENICRDYHEDFGSVGRHHYAASSTNAVPFKTKPKENNYLEKAEALKQNILRDFWDKEKHAFIDTYASGKNHITRHANIFAILYDFADETMQKEIVEHVLHNPDIDEITTPYFKLYELMALGKTGHMAEVQDYIDSYWGGMISNGATSAWEAYDPKKYGTEHYNMYGDPYDCSLCHAWGSGPIYLLTRYCAGVYPTSPGARTFAIAPDSGRYTFFDTTVPIGTGTVTIHYKDNHITVITDIPGGTLYWKGKQIPVPPNTEITV